MEGKHEPGTKVVFHPPYKNSKREGQKAEVVRRLDIPETGQKTVYVIQFGDGHKLAVHPEELSPA